MMQFSDDILMAYADGELDETTRREVQRAITADAVLAERARRQAAMRERLQAAYRPVLDEPLPERLLRTVGQTPTASSAGKLVSLSAVRSAKEERRAWTWAHWGGMAASVLLGVLMGKLLPAGGDDTPFETQSGHLIARGAVGKALSTQLASASTREGAVAVQLSFIDKSGNYCRTFTTTGLAGLACRDGADWTVQVLAPAEATSTGMRQAATALPPAILNDVDKRIQGSPLDATGEQAARSLGWKR